MEPIVGWDLINEAGELERLPVGAYACKIIEVTEVKEKQYLDVYFDIAEGKFKGYFKTLQDATGKNYGHIIRSYKKDALPFFKGFITAVEKSNPNYKWDWNEKGLNGKFCTVVFREEEYLKDGAIEISVKPDEVRSLQALRENRIKIKPLKKLDTSTTTNEQPTITGNIASIDISDDELPF